RTPYALAVALVVSATSIIPARVESNITTRRTMMSFTSTPPLGSCRTVEIAPSGSLLTAVTGPSWRMGGSDCATATELVAAPSAMAKANMCFMGGLQNVVIPISVRSISDDDDLSAATGSAGAGAGNGNETEPATG